MTTPLSDEPERPPLRILLTEDTVAVQELISAMLRKWGYHVDIAATGLQAVHALERERYDLVLMDIGMPEMDGLQATATIREREKQTGGHVPILAMTALTSEEDVKGCIDAGMDAYIPKPVQIRQLLEAIDRIIPAVELETQEAANPGTLAAAYPANFREQAMSWVEGDVDLLRMLTESISESVPDYLAQILSAIRQNNCEDLMMSAHAVKGIFGTVGVNPAFETAEKLEEMGRCADPTDADQTHALLEVEFRRLEEALNSILSDEGK